MRVLAATNKDLESEVAQGQFREDLYFRLNVVPIRCPPLRERLEDIPLLAQAFLEQFCRENGGREKPADPEVFDLLEQRPWPGNVRELQERGRAHGDPERLAHHASTTCRSDWIGHRPREAQRGERARRAAGAEPGWFSSRSSPTSACRCASSATAPRPPT